MSNDRQHEYSIAERAALWISQLPTADAAMRREFVRWIKQSPVHVREMLVANALDMELGKHDPHRKIQLDALFLRAANNVTALTPEKRDDAPESVADAGNAPGAVSDRNTNENAAVTAPAAETKPHGWKPSSWVIGIAAAASILALALGWPGIIEGIGLTDQYLTQTGEQRAIRLADGSVIHINTQSSVRVAFSRKTRDVYLDEGQATFDVAHDASRPFRVHVERSVVQAIGTQFDVYRQTDHIDVAVIEGRVKITAERAAAPAASTDVPAGKGVRIAADGSVSQTVDIDATHVLAWRNRQLVFRSNTLMQIAAEFNRYNKAPKIRVDGESLQAKRYSGLFEANEPDSFLQYLAVDQHLAFDRNDNDQLVVVRMRSSHAQTPADESHRLKAARGSSQ